MYIEFVYEKFDFCLVLEKNLRDLFVCIGNFRFFFLIILLCEFNKFVFF